MTVLVALLGFGVLAAVLVPWQPVPESLGPLVLPEAAEVFTAEELAASAAYSWPARWWSWTGLAVSLAVAGVLGFTRLGRALMARLPNPWWLRAWCGVAVVLLAGRLATLPTGVGGWRLRVEHGLSTQTWAGYLRDVAVGFTVNVAITGLAVVVLLAIVRRWRTWWPAIAAGAFAALVLAGSWLLPVLVEPLFHEFTPLAEGELRTEVIALAEAEGVEVGEVLVADASRRTTTLNAWVSGFGSTKRVVLYDTLVEDLPRDEAMLVVAHELAHAAHSDVLVGTTLGALGVAAAVAALGLIAFPVGRGSAGGGAGGAGRDRRPTPTPTPTPAHVPFILALVAFASVVVAPAENGLSRLVELRADVVALEVTGDAEAFERMQRGLALRSLRDPEPPRLSQWWFGSHPTVLERIGLARLYGHAARE